MLIMQCRAKSFIQQRRRYTDKALQWGQKNSRVAQECLKQPEITAPPIHAVGFEDYWKLRGWVFPTCDDQKYAKSLTSHVLSAPLTIASQLLSPVTTRERRILRWCCIGARAEATLPVEYWKEIILWSQQNLHIQLDFVGPEAFSRRRSSVMLRKDPADQFSSSITLRWLYNGMFHTLLERRQMLPSWDAYILFNPGMGHDHLKESWKPTLDVILSQPNNPPTLFTAHSHRDAERDARILEVYGIKAIYCENEFSSRVTYEDPFDHGHFVRPNHFVFLQSKTIE